MSGPSRSAQERLERIAEAQFLLSQVSRALGPAMELEATVKSVLAAMRELVDFRGGSISLVERGHLRIAAADPAVSDEVLDVRLPVGSGIGGRVIETGQTIYVPDLDDDSRVVSEVRSAGSNAGMVSFLAVPLVCLGVPIGLLQVDSSERDAFDDIDVMLLEGLAAQTANAIESARQYSEQARIDGLKTGFINLVSHELRTPLTIAGGMLQTYRTLRADDPDVDHDELLGRADVALARLGRLIEELLMMSQLAAGEIHVVNRPVVVADLLAVVVTRSMDPSHVEVACPEGLVVSTDGRVLGRVLDAMVENALTYAGHAELHAAGRVFEIRDHGPGIPDDVIGHEQETFSRSRQNATTVAGLGLGLSMATALVTELDGELQIRTSPTGTTIRVTLAGE